jgi:hypothetical protein
MDHERRDAPTKDDDATRYSKAATPCGRTLVDNARAHETSEMKQWAQELNVNKPIPKDLLPLLAKDDAKQMGIVLKNMSLDRKGT